MLACKMYADVLNKRLLKWLECNNKICDEQNGFRPKRSCEDHIYTLHSIIKSSLAENKQIYSCFIDFSQALDHINRNNLWFKLLSIGINGRMYHAIKSLYENVTCRIKFKQWVWVY